MKKLFYLLFMLGLTLSFIAPIQGQPIYPEQRITVNTSDLTVDQLAKIKADAELKTMQKKLDTYGNWVGVGGEVGLAVKEGLNAVVDVSEKFGKTDVGKFTMLMVAWKIMGAELVRIVLGLLFFITFTLALTFLLRRLTKARKIKTKSNGWMFWLPQEYEVKPPLIEGDGDVLAAYIIYIVAFGLCVWITFGLMFA